MAQKTNSELSVNKGSLSQSLLIEMTTTAQRPLETMSKSTREAIVDRLRACKTTEEILKFEEWFDSETKAGPLYEVICDFLKSRCISRALAAKWLSILIYNRDNKNKLI